MRDKSRPMRDTKELPPTDGDRDNLKNVEIGDLCLSVGNASEALAYYKKAFTEIPPNDRNVKFEVALKILACLKRQARFKDALTFIASIEKIFEGESKSSLLIEKASLLCHLGKYTEAKQVCKDAAQGLEGNSVLSSTMYLVLGHIFSRICQWRQAIRCFKKAAALASICEDSNILGNAYNNLGIAYKNLCRFRVSSILLRRAVKVANAQHDSASLAVRLLNLSVTLFKAGEIVEADSAIDECMKIASRINLRRIQSLALICKARTELIKGSPPHALELIRRATKVAQDLGDRRMLAIAYETHGEILTVQGKLQEAEQILRQSLPLIRSERDVHAELSTRLGEVALLKGNHSQAAEFAREALKIAFKIGDKYEAGRAIRILAMARQDESVCRRLLEKASALFGASEARLERAITLLRLAGLRSTGNDDAIALLSEAIRRFEISHAVRYKTEALCLFSSRYLDCGKLSEATRCLKEAEEIAGQGNHEKRMVRDIRQKLDREISELLSPRRLGRYDTFDSLHSSLSKAVGADILILARFGERTEIVGCVGIPSGRAHRIAERLKDRDLPLVSSSPKEDMGTDFESIGGIVALPVTSAGKRGVLIVGWTDSCSFRLRFDPSLVVKMRLDIGQVSRMLARATISSLNSVPVCICGIITRDIRMKEIIFSLPRIAKSSANVLITGETGTGKELVARALHALSERASARFVAQNCAALPEHLLESELFGHSKGAFTGAGKTKQGLLEVADGGTFFLDEISEISVGIQAKMLRVIECGEIRRVGETSVKKVDVRFISATNKDLLEEVEKGRFRKDLYYRLNVVSIKLPPLRDRRDDIPLLARVFLARFSAKTGKRLRGIHEDALEALISYDWPGNVRELENEIERAVTIADDGSWLSVDMLSQSISQVDRPAKGLSLKSELMLIERKRIVAALTKHNWNKTRAARELGDISRPALIAKMRRLGIPLSPG